MTATLVAASSSTWRSLVPAAIAVGALAMPLCAAASTVSVLNNGDFETAYIAPLKTGGFSPANYGTWSVGDPSATTGTVNGITPMGGSLMMDFSATFGTSADVYQIVDVSAYAAQIDAGLVTVDWSVYYNAASRTSAMMSIFRYSSAPTTFSGNGFAILTTRTLWAVDGDKNTWEKFSWDGVLLTSGTRYLLAGLNSPTSSAQTYADNASMVLHINDGLGNVPEPGTAWLVLAAALGVAASRRR